MKIHREGTSILLASFMVLLLLNLLIAHNNEPSHFRQAFHIISAVFFLLLLNFFRYPKRIYKGEVENMIVAPADGTIVAIEEVEENEWFNDRRLQVSIFMTVFNVHANWIPFAGSVMYVVHHSGRFMAAYLPKSSTENERSTVVIKAENGQEILVRQVAGALARRIVTYPRKGKSYKINDELGFIKFGSRVDLYLPLGSELLVEMDQKVTGNITQIAKLPVIK
ncbi:MAG: phosphatidylserine decarboxylase family protein [Bacteroidales bacterium]|nr:phosphatidylserine decarboxylase family protein [Bacteroidales bacterium]